MLLASWWLSPGTSSRPLSSLKSLSKKPESLGLEGAAPPDSGARGAASQVAPKAWSAAWAGPRLLSGPGPCAAAAGSPRLSLGSLFPGALLELTSSFPGPVDESVAWSPVRPGTGRESVKKKRDLAAGASALASFPRFFPLASD